MSIFQDQTLSELKNKYRNEQILNLFSNEQILEHLQKKNRVQQFLLTIQSEELRIGFRARKQKQMDDDDFRVPTYKRNVLDFPLKDLLYECSQHEIISKFQYNVYMSCRKERKQFHIRDHKRLGKALVQMYPDQFDIGQRSTHYNPQIALQIERQYGIFRDEDGDIIQEHSNHEEEEGGENNENQDSQSMVEDSEDNFLVPDDQIEEEDEDSESIEVQVVDKKRKIKKEKKKARKLLRKKNSSEEQIDNLIKDYKIQENPEQNFPIRKKRKVLDIDSE